MDPGHESSSLVNQVEVGRRFRRSVNLDRDAGSPDALDGYVVTPAIRRALSQITGGLDDAAGDRAWSLVGPYGSGKSAFAVFLADLLSQTGSPGAAAKRLLNGSAESAPLRQPLYPALLTAERAPLDTLLLKSLRSTGRSHLGDPERRQAEGAGDHQGAVERLGPGALPVCDLRCRRMLRGSGSGQ